MIIRPAPGLTIEQQPEDVLMRMCVWAEARGQSPIGQLGVLWTIRNRAQRLGWSLSKVILKPKWFSSFNQGDPNRALLLDAYKTSERSWAVANAICSLFENGATNDPTSGATHYYNFKTVHPAWGRGHPTWDETVVLGDHVFGIQT